MNSRPELRNYKMKSIVRMTREIVRMPSEYAVDYPTFPVNQRHFHLYRDPERMLSRPGGLLSRNDKPPDIWDTDGIRETFL